jgi:ElaB/YqjD/DUF883 family membrane-anchored ribosome-binding protein
MDEDQNLGQASEGNKDDLKASVENLKESASAKVQEISQTVGQKADDIRSAAQDKAQEFREMADSAWSEAKSWEAEVEAYISKNPIKAVSIGFGVGFMLGLLLRK